MRLRAPILLLAVPVLQACTQFPAIDRKVDPAVALAPYPTLRPFEEIDAAKPATPPADPAAALLAQAAALKARSDALQAQQE